MSKQVSKTFIGAFVLGSLALLVLGIILLSGRNVFQQATKFVLFFEGSVSGLNVGSPVVFRGVNIGTVDDIYIVADTDTATVNIPVIINMDPQHIRLKAGEEAFEGMDALIKQGLKAQLTLQSFLTGQLMIEFDFHPHKPIRLVGTELPYTELPTIPFAFRELGKTLQSLPVNEIATNLVTALNSLSEVLNEAEIQDILKSVQPAVHNLDTLIRETTTLVRNMNRRVDPLADELTDTLADADQLIRNLDSRAADLTRQLSAQMDRIGTAADHTLVQARKTLALDAGVPGELASELKTTLTSARETVELARQTFTHLRQISTPDSVLIYEAGIALKELSAAARAFRSVAEYLERHPEALLRGKNGIGAQR